VVPGCALGATSALCFTEWGWLPGRITAYRLTLAGTGVPPGGLHRSYRLPGVVFSGSLDGHFRAYDSSSGKVLLDVNTINEYETTNSVPARGGSINGPGATIAGGMVFVNSGYSSIGFMPGNVLLAFSVDGK
jgi:hypothetical protein